MGQGGSARVNLVALPVDVHVQRSRRTDFPTRDRGFRDAQTRPNRSQEHSSQVRRRWALRNWPRRLRRLQEQGDRFLRARRAFGGVAFVVLFSRFLVIAASKLMLFASARARGL